MAVNKLSVQRKQGVLIQSHTQTDFLFNSLKKG